MRKEMLLSLAREAELVGSHDVSAPLSSHSNSQIRKE